MSQLGDHLHSVRWELAAVGAGLVAVGIRDWDWGNGSGFQFIEEGWFAKNTRHGGMDKIGHAFSTYVIADILTDRIRANAANPTGAQITGALVAFGIMGLGETLDGFTGKHRFSREDIVANGAGALFSILRNSVPGMREKLDWRIMYTPASYELPGITSSEDSGILPPYQRQRYIMALKGSGFDELKNTPLRYVELHAGFDARGFELDERRTWLSDRTDVLCRGRPKPQRGPLRSGIHPELGEVQGHAAGPGRPEDLRVRASALHGRLLRQPLFDNPPLALDAGLSRSVTPFLTSLRASCPPLVTPLHATGLGLSLRRRQYHSGCCEAECSRPPHKRKSLSTRDRFRSDGFAHVRTPWSQSPLAGESLNQTNKL